MVPKPNVPVPLSAMVATGCYPYREARRMAAALEEKGVGYLSDDGDTFTFTLAGVAQIQRGDFNQWMKSGEKV